MKTSFLVICLVLASATSEDANAVYTSVEGLVDTLKGFMVTLRDCGCNMDGSEDKLCDDAGQCNCKCNVQGEKCDSCMDGFFGFPACQGINQAILLSFDNQMNVFRLCLQSPWSF